MRNTEKDRSRRRRIERERRWRPVLSLIRERRKMRAERIERSLRVSEGLAKDT